MKIKRFNSINESKKSEKITINGKYIVEYEDKISKGSSDTKINILKVTDEDGKGIDNFIEDFGLWDKIEELALKAIDKEKK